MLRQRWLIVGLLAAVVLGGGWILARNDMDEKTVLFDIGLTPEATAKKLACHYQGRIQMDISILVSRVFLMESMQN